MINFPATFTQNTSIDLDVTLSDYPAGTWTLVLTFVSPTDKQTVNATASGTDYNVALTAAETAAFNAERYDWQAAVTDGTDRYIVDSGIVNVCADFSVVTTGLDARSNIEQQIEAMTAVIYGTASTDQQRVKYRDREVQKYPVEELIKIVQFLKRELAKEQQAAKIAAGMGSGNKIKVRFL